VQRHHQPGLLAVARRLGTHAVELLPELEAHDIFGVLVSVEKDDRVPGAQHTHIASDEVNVVEIDRHDVRERNVALHGDRWVGG